MNVIDPRDLSDRQLLVHLALGPLPRPGWPGRRSYIARQLARMAVEGLVFVLALVGLLGAVLLVWAASLPVPQ